jgi:hypothetical protein
MNLFCTHNEVHIARCHPSVLKPGDKDKILYIDVHNVANLIRCAKCGKTLKPMQREQIYAPRVAESTDDVLNMFKWMSGNPTWAKEWRAIQEVVNKLKNATGSAS